ncbi:MAG: asparagine synthase (glutamine-hydrolyzing) [Thermaurantimonas sp.]|uniref:asparagine synthase (glutamine-hydrolyzing) n=1 Tax=Thermaurantimonas sp. TaxID=2681568 RepID=UPI00391AE72B
MCGISGFVDKALSKDDAQAIIARMVGSQLHRGPDYQGIDSPSEGVWLGHNRLAIIDLTPDGHQPMARGHLTISYNGEIYNYIEIRTELEKAGYHFTSHSDTEVILKAYEHWGADCVQHFRGMWAFALWDAQKNRLFCSRDRFGIKPFHYIHKGEAFYFASEIKALKHSRLYSGRLNSFQLMRDVQLGWSVYSNETHFHEIKQLRPGENLIFDGQWAFIYPYYCLEYVHLDPTSQPAEEFRARFFESIRLHMRADVEVGSTFSGGLDSSAVVSAVQHLFSPEKFQTFTVWYEGADERPFARQVWKKYPVITPHTLQPNPNEISEAFVRATRQFDIPVSGSSYLSQYFVMKLANEQGIKVLLDGQGSDEYLMGYHHSLYRLFATYIRQGRLLAFIRELSTFSQMQQWGLGKVVDVFLKSMLSSLLTEQHLYRLEYHHFYPNAFGRLLKTNFFFKTIDAEPLRNFSWHLLYTSILQTLLLHEDRNSMAFSIEARVPFLDHHLVEYTYSLPPHWKIYKGYTKYVLRKALADIMPEGITWRVDKKGFVTPGEILWLRNQLRWLLDEDMHLPLIERAIWEREKVKFLIGDNKNARWIWRVASLNYWYKNLK